MPKWTPDQQTAIDDRGGALLVSAAAGSGKTAVLTERVLRRLTDENDPVDIDRIVLVRQPPEHALGQHGCLARAGCRRNQQCAAAVVDRGLLIRCPLRHCRPLLTAPRIPCP